MAKLYLIRRNLESFAGPLTLNDMRDAYKRMAFGLQDEVSGHCGPWVTFDDLPSIKKYYPEVARIVNDEMLAGWGVSGGAVRIVNEDTKRIDVRKQKGLGLAITFLLIAVVAFVAAIYMANNARLSGKFRENREDVTIDKLQGFVDRNDAAGLNVIVGENLDQILEKYKKSKKPDPRWLPYLRAYAFANEGSIPGLNPKVLRGDAGSAAPVDCSLKAWRMQWRASVKNWNEMIVDRKLVRSHWGRLLAWDPHWIRRRADRKNWPGLSSYYVACLIMAEKAVSEMMTDVTLVSNSSDWEKIGITKIKQRLQWLLDISRSGTSSVPATPAVDNTLSVWTCFESARDIKDLAACRTAMVEDQDALSAYNEEKFGWNFARIVFSARGPVPPELVPTIAAYGTKLPKVDYFTRLDFRTEQKVLKALGRNNLPIEKTLEKLQSELPDMRILP
jgi:hypothetical protein